MDEIRKADLTERVTQAVEVRDLSSLKRGGDGAPPLAVMTCLGPGRCHIPGSQSSGITCPFCVRLPSNASSKDIPEFVNRVVSGN